MRIVIIGNGIAATSAAEKIREYDTTSSITMLSDESTTFYSRPRLIEYVAGKVLFEQIIIKNQQWYSKRNIDLQTGTKVLSVVPAKNQIVTSRGIQMYDLLLIASGASAYVPSFSNQNTQNTFVLRTKEHADQIIEAIKNAHAAAIIGGGLLGIETGFALTSRGLATTIIETADRLLPRQLDAESSLLLKKLLEEKGLNFLTNIQTASLETTMDGLRINFANHPSLTTDMAIISAGVRPNIDFLKDSGITTQKGIIVDSSMRTNIDNIYAAGDCAEFKGLLYGIWPAAKEQGDIAGMAMVGKPAVYQGSVMSTKLKVVGIEVASIGNFEQSPGTKVESIYQGSSFKKLFYENGVLKGAILIGNTSDYFKLQKEIKP